MSALARSVSSSGVSAIPSADDNPYLPPSPFPTVDAAMPSALAAALSALHAKALAHDVVDSFLLVNADGGPNYRATVALLRRALPLLYAGHFAGHPAEPVKTLIFSDQPAYVRFCAARHGGACPTPFGGYELATGDIVMHATKGGETVLHEAVHALQYASGEARFPLWILEAEASLYENPVFCRERVTGIANWRYDDARAAVDHPEDPAVPPLEGLFSMDAAAFTATDPAHPEDGTVDPGRRLRHAGLARFFAQWMDRRGHLVPWIHALRDGIATDPDGRAAFRAVVGSSPGEAEHDFDSYVRSIAPPAEETPCSK